MMIPSILTLPDKRARHNDQKRCARRILSSRKMFLITILWFITSTLAPLHAQKPDRSGPPKLGPPPTLKLPPIQHFRLTNGLPVLLLEKHEVPLVQINLVVKVGSTVDPPGKSGLAGSAANMLTEGAGTRNALQLADAIDFLGARLVASAG